MSLKLTHSGRYLIYKITTQNYRVILNALDGTVIEKESKLKSLFFLLFCTLFLNASTLSLDEILQKLRSEHSLSKIDSAL